MSKTNESPLREQRLAALKAMEIKATDAEDLELCASDMRKFASLDASEARIVASAIRAKYLPSIAREAGLDDETINEIVEAPEEQKTADFADDTTEDLPVDDMPFGMEDEGDEDEQDPTTENEDSEDDSSEANDEDIATFQIEVPAPMREKALKAVQDALDEVLGGDSSDDADMNETDDAAPEMADDAVGDMDDSDEAEKSPLTAFNKVNNMTKKALAERRAQREEILRTVLAEEGKPFKFDADAQYKGEEAYPSMTMENSGGNSLQGDNPSFAAQRVPTNNPDLLQLEDAIEAFKLEGAPTLEYTMSIEDMDVPSEGADMPRLAPVPTQMKQPANKTTVAMEMGDEAEGAACECCGKNSEGAGMIECPDCGKSFECCEACEGKLDSGEMGCPKCKTVESDVEVNFNGSTASADAEVKTAAAAAELQKTAELERARIKVAFGCSYKLALANLINEAEVEAYAEQMLNDGLRAEAMIRQTKLMLRSAQSNAERVAAAAAEKLSVRTASVGLSTSPALTTASAVNSAALDIQSALKGTWTMPRVED